MFCFCHKLEHRMWIETEKGKIKLNITWILSKTRLYLCKIGKNGRTSFEKSIFMSFNASNLSHIARGKYFGFIIYDTFEGTRIEVLK